MNNCDTNVIAVGEAEAKVETFLHAISPFLALSSSFEHLAETEKCEYRKIVCERVQLLREKLLHNLHLALFFSLERL